MSRLRKVDSVLNRFCIICRTAVYYSFSVTQEKKNMQFFKEIKKKIHRKLLEYPAYVKLLQFRDKVTKRMLTALLAFFDLIAPVLTFLCTKKPDTELDPNRIM